MKLHYPFGQPPEGVDVLWRCETKRYSHLADPRLELYWHIRNPLDASYTDDCQLTVDEAVKDFIARRKRQIAILESQLQRAQRELNLTVDNPRLMEFMQ